MVSTYVDLVSTNKYALNDKCFVDEMSCLKKGFWHGPHQTSLHQEYEHAAWTLEHLTLTLIKLL